MKLKLTFQFFLTAKKSLFKREFCKLASKEIKKMTVNKRILEQKTNQELEDYIKPESKFIDLAKIYAFEILQTRGRLLNDEETKTYNELIANEKNNEIVEIHPNYKKATLFINISALIGIGNIIWDYENFNTTFSIVIAIFIIGSLFLIGYFIEKGNEIAKYLFIILFILGLVSISIPSLFINFLFNPVLGTLNLLQTIMQFCALVLLIGIPAKKKQII
jgi:hypothetical protein